MSIRPAPSSRSGFTLVELVMVVALLAMIAALAVNRLSGLRADSADKLNLANLSRVANIVDAYAIANEAIPNRLDSLFACDLPSGTAGSFDAAGSASSFLPRFSDANTGLHPDLTNAVSYYGHAFVPLLGTYFLSAAEAEALRRAGLVYLMRATDGDHLRSGDDHACLYINSADANNEDLEVKRANDKNLDHETNLLMFRSDNVKHGDTEELDGYLNKEISYVFEGYIWNHGDEDVTWTLAENFDDNVRLTIDGAVVLNNDSSNTPTKNTVTLFTCAPAV